MSNGPGSTSTQTRSNVVVEEEVVVIDVCFGLSLATSFPVQSPM